MSCKSPDQHELVPGNCPSCNPEGYQRLLSQAPQPTASEPEQADARPTRRTERPATHDGGYSDRY